MDGYCIACITFTTNNLDLCACQKLVIGVVYCMYRVVVHGVTGTRKKMSMR